MNSEAKFLPSISVLTLKSVRCSPQPIDILQSLSTSTEKSRCPAVSRPRSTIKNIPSPPSALKTSGDFSFKTLEFVLFSPVISENPSDLIHERLITPAAVKPSTLSGVLNNPCATISEARGFDITRFSTGLFISLKSTSASSAFLYSSPSSVKS